MADGHAGDTANFVEMVDDAGGGATALAKRGADAPPPARTAGTQREPMNPNQRPDEPKPSYTSLYIDRT